MTDVQSRGDRSGVLNIVENCELNTGFVAQASTTKSSATPCQATPSPYPKSNLELHPEWCPNR